VDREELTRRTKTLVGHTITAVEYVRYDYDPHVQADIFSFTISDGRTFQLANPDIRGEGKAKPRVVNHAGLFLVKAELKEFVEGLQEEESDAYTSEHANAD
jgi:hypothetical protein